MIVPDFWAEARATHKAGRKRITVRRFGWSHTSLQDAQAMADARASEALARVVAGDAIDRRERRAAYNTPQGLPIREEVLARHGDEVITRNAYGAHCLNTPRVLFADVDFDEPTRIRPVLIVLAVLALGCLMVGGLLGRWGLAAGLLVVSALLAWPLATWLHRIGVALEGGHERRARRRLQGFLASHPKWNVRLYKTPGGLRLLATHQAFDPSAPEVEQFFAAVQADRLYVRMCLNQHCFRARLTAKPWRIGIKGRMRPRPGVWPVEASAMPMRTEWIVRYEARAQSFAACRFVESLGSGTVHTDLVGVIELHDRLSRALQTDLAVA